MTRLNNRMDHAVTLQNPETGEHVTLQPSESVDLRADVLVQQSSHLWPLVWLVGMIGFFAALILG